MYQKIKTQILKNPTWKTITLSGNVHNMLLNWREEIKAGAYLKSDSQLNITNSILSFNHYYSKGSMINDMGTGLNLRELDNSKATFATSVNYDNYLLVYPDGLNVSHNAIIFSRKITAAKMVSYK